MRDAYDSRDSLLLVLSICLMMMTDRDRARGSDILYNPMHKPTLSPLGAVTLSAARCLRRARGIGTDSRILQT
jgi:hypothetical protein